MPSLKLFFNLEEEKTSLRYITSVLKFIKLCQKEPKSRNRELESERIKILTNQVTARVKNVRNRVHEGKEHQIKDKFLIISRQQILLHS